MREQLRKLARMHSCVSCHMTGLLPARGRASLLRRFPGLFMASGTSLAQDVRALLRVTMRGVYAGPCPGRTSRQGPGVLAHGADKHIVSLPAAELAR